MVFIAAVPSATTRGAAEPATRQASPLPVVTAKPTPKSRTPEDAITPAIKDANRHAEFLHRITEGKVGLLFLGDSIMDGWPRRGEWSWLKFAPYNPANFGVSGDRTEHLLWRITHGELDGIAPKVVVLMIGTNNIGLLSEKPEWVANGVKKIVETIHGKLPDTKVLLLGVFPRATQESAPRKALGEINRIIAGLDNGRNTRYLDLGKNFLDANGEIPDDIMPDKLHPSAKGYAIWYSAMQPLLEAMMK